METEGVAEVSWKQRDRGIMVAEGALVVEVSW